MQTDANESSMPPPLHPLYAERLPKRIDEIEELWNQLHAGEWDALLLQALHRNIHGLTGSSAAFGFSTITSASRALEDLLLALLAGDLPPPADQAARAGPLLDALQRAAAESMAAAPVVPAGELPPAAPALAPSIGSAHGTATLGKRRLIYLLTGDQPLANDLTVQLRNFGYFVQRLGQTVELQVAMTRLAPAAIILDGVSPDSAAQELHHSAEIRYAQANQIPVLLISSQDGS